MKRFICLVAIALISAVPMVAFADNDGDDGSKKFNHVKAGEFDPGKTFLVQGEWLSGIGCPTEAKTAACDPSDPNCNKVVPGPTYTDPACPTGDTKDKRNQGLLLAKTGPTTNVAAAVAELKNVKGIVLTELGYDLRKAGANISDPRGSHCGAGAPRFNVETSTAFYFVGCASPPPTQQTPGTGFMRLRWGVGGPLVGFNAQTGLLEPIAGTVKSITIVFDEGTDALGGPDNFGLAVLDNIDVNGVLVGRGDDGND
jgi:hypothetical protein